MSGFINKARHATGIGLDHDELYRRAFEKGVLLNKLDTAADTFDKASKKFMENGNQAMAAQAATNSLLYRYLITGDPNVIRQLLQTLQGLQQLGIQQIEAIGVASQTEMIAVNTLAAELDCRFVEATITGNQNDLVRSRDLHKLARDKFQVMNYEKLITYPHRPAADGPNDKPIMRSFYHSGMFSYYEAMVEKDTDPDAASNDLALANKSFKLCNHQQWQQTVTRLLDNWRKKCTCWVCGRDMQGYELHYSMCHAQVTPYMQKVLQARKEDINAIDLVSGTIAVCTACGSMVTFKAEEEADKVRQELNAKLAETMRIIQGLDNRISHLERMAHHH